MNAAHVRSFVAAAARVFPNDHRATERLRASTVGVEIGPVHQALADYLYHSSQCLKSADFLSARASMAAASKCAGVIEHYDLKKEANEALNVLAEAAASAGYGA